MYASEPEGYVYQPYVNGGLELFIEVDGYEDLQRVTVESYPEITSPSQPPIFALKEDGTLWTSGWNDGESTGGGFLGLGDTTDRNTLTQIPGTWTVFGEGGFERLALNDQDEMYYWGWNSFDGPTYTGIATQPVLSPTVFPKYDLIP